jgi:ABC-type sugar transport system ATPase subunit
MKDGERVLTDDASRFDEDKLIFHMIGRDLSDIYPPKSERGDGREIFSFRRSAGPGRPAVEFSVREGEVLGVGGLAGQGQIPLLESIFGLGDVSGVVLAVRGRECRPASPRQAMRAGIALIPEDRQSQAAFPVLDIASNIAAASFDRHSRLGFFRRLAEIREVREMAASLRVRMTSLAQELMFLSGGNIQKTVFARWLLAKPKVMVLLSPTSGIDIGTKQQIYSLIRDLAKSGVAVILLTGDMMELVGLCDRVMVMYGGAVSGMLRGGEITEENIMAASVARNQGRATA